MGDYGKKSVIAGIVSAVFCVISLIFVANMDFNVGGTGAYNVTAPILFAIPAFIASVVCWVFERKADISDPKKGTAKVVSKLTSLVSGILVVVLLSAGGFLK